MQTRRWKTPLGKKTGVLSVVPTLVTRTVQVAKAIMELKRKSNASLTAVDILKTGTDGRAPTRLEAARVMATSP